MITFSNLVHKIQIFTFSKKLYKDIKKCSCLSKVLDMNHFFVIFVQFFKMQIFLLFEQNLTFLFLKKFIKA